MNFETADKAASRLGVTVRAIQKWAKEGKIPYSHKVGRDWMIPTTAARPGSATAKKQKSMVFSAYPIMNFCSGEKIEDYMSSLRTEEEKAMARIEYYYMTGEIKKCTLEAEPLLGIDNLEVRAVAAVYCIFSNLSRGHLNKSRHASKIIQKIIEENISGKIENSLIAICVFSALAAKFQLQLPFEGIPEMKDYVRFLDSGMRAIGCYLLAYKEYLEKRYEKSLGISETALCFCERNYIIPKIYLHIVSAMSYINLMETEEAKKHMEKAIALAYPYEIIMPFVEHYNLLGGLIENALKVEYPDYYNKIIQYSKQYNISWYKVYNNNSETPVADNLTNTEFTIAMLYSRNWRVKEIASHMHLSERTVTNYISYVYDKLQINSKRELEKYMLR